MRTRPLSTPNPARITTALDLANLYGPEVDVALGGAEPMVDQWEAGKLTPTRTQMHQLAFLTGFAVDWFYMESTPPPDIMFICWSKKPDRHTPRCERIDSRPDAQIIPLHKDTLF